MRMIKKTLVLLLSAALCVILLAGCGPKEEAKNSDGLYFTKQEVRESPEWVQNLDAAQDADQLIVVAGVDKSTAYITMHEKDKEGNWQQLIEAEKMDDYLQDKPEWGKVRTVRQENPQGLGEANWKETYTPVGTFTIDKAFGLADDPGCQMEYTKVDDNYYWSGDYREGMPFNQLVSIKDYPDLDKEESERIADYDYAYQYVLNMGYNAENIPEKGCAFFLHSFRFNRPYTGGCVAVPEDIMKFIMQHVKPGCKITIDSLENFGGDLDA